MLFVAVLIDNRPSHSDEGLRVEHGLSFYIEYDGRSILCDMGASDSFLYNANCLGLPVTDCDWAFLSHAHADHAGGLSAFLRSSDRQPIYLSSHFFEGSCFSLRHERKRNITPDAWNYSFGCDRYRYVDSSVWVDERIALVKNICQDFDTPRGNRFLTRQVRGDVERPDPFSHELALVFLTDSGLVVLSSCSHGGALNIVRSAQQFTGIEQVRAFIGGLHFVDGAECELEVDQFQRSVDTYFHDTRFYVGHCTGEQARKRFEEKKSQIQFFHTGSVIHFD